MRTVSLLFYLIAAAGCDAFYHIPINGQTDGLKQKLDCGTMEIKMINWQGHAFDFYQNCDFKKPVTLYSDSIKAIWKNKTFPLVFVGGDYANKKSVTLSGKTEIRTAFYINEKVRQGDTILVISNGYLYCNNQKLDLDTLRLLPREDLNSPLENFFGKK